MVVTVITKNAIDNSGSQKIDSQSLPVIAMLLITITNLKVIHNHKIVLTTLAVTYHFLVCSISSESGIYTDRSG